MLFLGKILASPLNGILWIFNEIKKAAEEEQKGDAEAIKHELNELYILLELGKITEEEFEQREKILLDKLDTLENDKDAN